MKRLALPLAALLLTIPLLARAQSTGAESLALLDAALEQPAIDVEIAGRGTKDDLAGRDLLKAATVAAVRALDAIPAAACFADYWSVSRMAYDLMGRGIDLLYQADEYEAALDNDGRDRATEEFGLAFPAGYALFVYLDTLREQTTCSPVASPSPTPAHTVTPERTATPEPSL